MSMDDATSTDTSRHPLRIAVSGATGLIGSAVVERLRRDGHTVHRLVRSRARAQAGDVWWDPDSDTLDAAALEGVDAVVHLAGENVAERWTPAKRRAILDSRVRGTGLVARTLAGMQRPPRVLVQASATGIYGDRGDEPLDESAAPGAGFLAGVCQAWEAASAPAEQAGIRVVRLRFGVVLTARGGMLQRLLPPFRLGLGGPVGSGRQWLPWIEIYDAVGVVLRAIGDERLRGAVNAVAGSVRNEDFTTALGRAVHRPAVVPVPAFALRLAFGQMADEALLAGQRVEPRTLQDIGYPFAHPALDDALRAALAR